MGSYLRRLFTQSSAYTLGGALTQGFGILLVPLLTRFLTPSDYGIVTTFGVLLSVLTIFFLMSQHSAVARLYYDHRDSASALQSYIATVLTFLLVWGLALAALLLLGLGTLLSRLTGIPFVPFVALAVGGAFLQGVVLVKLTLFRVREEPRKYLAFQLTLFGLMLLGVILLVVVLGEGAAGRIWATFIPISLLALVSLVLLLRESGISFSRRHLKESLVFGVPLVPHNVSRQVQALADRFFLNGFRGLAETGVYAVGYALGAGLSLVLVGINSAWAPFFFDTAQRRGEEAKRVFARLTSYYTVVVVGLALVVGLFAKEIVAAFAGAAYQAAHQLVPWIVGAMVLKGLYYMSVNQIFYAKKTLWVFAGSGVAAAVHVLSNWVLVPRYGMFGAAYTTLISFGLLFFITFLIANRLYPIRYELRILLPLVVLPLILVTGYLLDRSANFSDVSASVVKLFLFLGFAALMLWVFFSKYERRKAKEWVGNVFGRVVAQKGS